MSKIFQLVSICSLIALISCKKEGDVYVINDGNFASTGLTASSSAVVLTQANENNTAVTFNWGEADFGDNTAVAYTVQMAKLADTTNGWTNVKNFAAGNNKLTYSFNVKALNDVLGTMGLNPGAQHDLVFRIKADVPQYNGALSSVLPVYSNAILVKITTYGLSLYIPGEYQGWNPGNAPEMKQIEGHPGIYEAYVYMPGTGTKYFKYTNARDWNHTNYGDGGNGSFSTDGAAGGLFVPNGGFYQLSANLNTNKWTASATTWGIIGDATPGGWNNDTPMIYDAATGLWKLTVNLTSTGSFKFRANNSWALNFGIDGTGKLRYADNPLIPYTPGLNNLSVPVSGDYTITLDLRQSQNYTYTLVKN